MSYIYKILTVRSSHRSLLGLVAFLLLGLTYAIPINAASLVAKVDRQRLSIDETLTLNIISDQRSNDSIDLKGLEAQFDIVNRQKNTQASIINGSVTVSTNWTFIIAPKETGQLLIPSFTIDGVYSEAIKVEVTDSTTAIAGAHGKALQGDVILQASTNKTQVYVQEQILLTFSLYYKTALSGYTPEDLVIDNATLENIAENNFQKNVGGINYNVLERVYAIHPQASGTLTIPKQTWQVEKSSNRFGFGRSNSPYLRVRSRAQTIEVKPRPTSSQAQHWLPATNVTLDQEWQQSILTAKVGEPLNYSLTLSADGLSFSQLPAIPFDSDDFTIYTEQGKTNNLTSRKGILGNRTDNFAIIPKKAGTFTLPEIRLSWWDVVEDKEKTITLAAQNIIVGNSTLAQEVPEIPSSSTTSNSDTAFSTNTKNASANTIWILMTCLFAIATLFFLCAWLRLKKSLSPDNHHSTELNEVNKVYKIKALYQKIEMAVEAEQWEEVKQLLNQWAKKVSGQELLNNYALKQYYPQLSSQLDAIDQYLYGANDHQQSTAKMIDSQALIALLEQLKTQQANNNTSPLKALY